MNVRELAKRIAIDFKLPKAYKYDAVFRDYDQKVELIGLVDDPNYDMKDFTGREMLFPKRWVTLEVFSAEKRV